MKEVKQMAAQGDVMFIKVAKIPEAAVLEKTKGPVVVAHSETGHHHTADGALMFRDPTDTMTCYLQMEGCETVRGGIDIKHHRPYDTHEAFKLLGNPGDTWMVRRQREHTPEGWRRVED